MNKDSLEKTWNFIQKAQNEVSLRFTNDKECDDLVNEAYNELEKIKNKIHKIVDENKWFKN